MSWARPAFLWTMSVVLPAAAIPVVLIEDELRTTEGASSPPSAPVDEASVVLFLLWFIVPPACAALCLIGYRGGASICPLFGRGIVAGVVTLASLPLSALFVLAAFVGTDFPEPYSLPFFGWFIAVALYFQALRAAAVHRSLPRVDDDVAAVFE